MAKRPSRQEVKQENRIKIEFTLNPDENFGIRTESLWAERLKPGQFRLLNSPFFAFGVSAEDIVSAVNSGKGDLRFKEVIQRGGHSTYRIFLQEGRNITSPEFNLYWQPIGQEGATFETANGKLISIDIPPGHDVRGIYELLNAGEKAGIWAFEEVYYYPKSKDPRPDIPSSRS